MKLRTEMRDGCVHVQGCCIDEDNVSPLQVAILKRDAAAAHALMQAIDEIGTRGIQDADEIANRADELMHEWGFES